MNPKVAANKATLYFLCHLPIRFLIGEGGARSMPIKIRNKQGRGIVGSKIIPTKTKLTETNQFMTLIIVIIYPTFNNLL